MSLGLFVASEVTALKLADSPYEEGSSEQIHAMKTLRAVNIWLFAAQPVVGFIAAHPGLLGIPPEHRSMFSRVLRTVHFGTGLTLATTYTVNAAFQW